MHTLLSPELGVDVALDSSSILMFACSCRKWTRVVRYDHFSSQQEIESDHTLHAQLAGAEDMKGSKLWEGFRDVILKATPKEHIPPTLQETLDTINRLANESQIAESSMVQYLEAYKEARERGIGLVVERQANGGYISTPNVFVEAGKIIFIKIPPADALPFPETPLKVVA
jgi:hypothetical protein